MTKQEEYLYKEILDRTQEIIQLKDEVLNLKEELSFEQHCKNTYKAGFDHCIKQGIERKNLQDDANFWEMKCREAYEVLGREDQD